MKKKNHTVAVLGSINMDLVTHVPFIPKQNEVVLGSGLHQLIGGKATNVAIGLQRLGVTSFLIGKIGKDSFASKIKQIFVKEEMDNIYIEEEDTVRTGSVIVVVDAHGYNATIVNEDANIQISKANINNMLHSIDVKETRIDCLYLTLEPQSEIVEYAIREFSKREIMIFCDAAPTARPLKEEYYSLVTYLSANEFEALAMTQIQINSVADAKKAAYKLRSKGVKNVLLTLGGLGALLLPEKSDQIHYYPSHKVQVKDVLAAGDAFRAGFTAELLATKNTDKSMKFAISAGAFAVTKFGAFDALPTREQVMSLR